jgi:hypothetical protein
MGPCPGIAACTGERKRKSLPGKDRSLHDFDRQVCAGTETGGDKQQPAPGCGAQGFPDFPPSIPDRPGSRCIGHISWQVSTQQAPGNANAAHVERNPEMAGKAEAAGMRPAVPAEHKEVHRGTKHPEGDDDRWPDVKRKKPRDVREAYRADCDYLLYACERGVCIHDHRRRDGIAAHGNAGAPDGMDPVTAYRRDGGA